MSSETYTTSDEMLFVDSLKYEHRNVGSHHRTTRQLSKKEYAAKLRQYLDISEKRSDWRNVNKVEVQNYIRDKIKYLEEQ